MASGIIVAIQSNESDESDLFANLKRIIPICAL